MEGGPLRAPPDHRPQKEGTGQEGSSGGVLLTGQEGSCVSARSPFEPGCQRLPLDLSDSSLGIAVVHFYGESGVVPPRLPMERPYGDSVLGMAMILSPGDGDDRSLAGMVLPRRMQMAVVTVGRM